MDTKGFDPIGKTFHFCLDKYTCFRCKTGICSLENISVEELENSSSCVHAFGESSIEYCRGMAKLFLDNEFTAPATIYLNTECGHYSFADGQHRTCVVARVLQKGRKVTLNAKVIEQNCFCRDCLIKAHYAERENSLKPVDKFFKTKKYRDIKQLEKDYEQHEFMYSFLKK